MVRARYSDKEFMAAVAENRTIAAVLRALGLTLRPGNYRTVHRKVLLLGLSTSHWDPLGAVREALNRSVINRTIPLEQILVEKSSYNSHMLKKRLLAAGILVNKCAICGISEWNGKLLSLQLDHINGQSDDHRRANLRLLCPNCHSQTPTFCRRKQRSERVIKKVACPRCGGEKSYAGRQCAACAAKALERIKWPSIEKLLAEVENNSYVAVAARLGVTDNAIRKRLRSKLGYVPKNIAR